MRKYVCLLMMLLLLVACGDQIRLKPGSQDNKLVVYSFPTDGDSLDIEVSSSENLESGIRPLDNVRVACLINGKDMPVEFVKDKSVRSGIPLKLYRLRYPVHTGDHIRIAVSASGFPSVFATAQVPSRPKMSGISLDTLFIKGEWYTRIRCMLEDDPRHQDFYAVRVLGQEYGEDDSIVVHTEDIETSDEPLLNNYNTGDEGINTSNDFYHNFYIFDDTGLSDSLYVLHLNTPVRSYVAACRIELYHITSDMYHFLKSLNDLENNDFSNYGMSFVRPSYTNISNGSGILGACSLVQSEWLK